MKKGIDFIESRLYRKNNETLLNNELVELPPIFRTFIQNFKWNNKVVTENEGVFFIPHLSGGEIYLANWNYEEIFSKPIVFQEDELQELGFVTIASSNRGIYLGTKGKDIDKIFTYKNSLEKSYIQIAENIFQFVNGLTDNLSSIAETEIEYREYMTELGYTGEDLEQEVKDWIE